MKNVYQRICRQCNSLFDGGPRAWYCPRCRAERIRERKIKYWNEGPKRALGSTDKCENCGCEYVVNGGMQKYCDKCAPIMIKQADRQQALNYYYAKRESINKARKIKRRDIRKCPICGTDYWAVGGAIACSQEHKKEVIKQRTVIKISKGKK
ncbi:MAG TPA: hypothetical protein DHW61_10760 [Lachnoclostridium phytofermentans]|uniref:Uncharacterized protein n=1 Tax=Lachnoclostridium phytofermentans TaxID=66219 RepID=A0A3D2X6X4_9FIRM|nr:hypothetical protein [Lachnoclostridium phytofermentans]